MKISILLLFLAHGVARGRKKKLLKTSLHVGIFSCVICLLLSRNIAYCWKLLSSLIQKVAVIFNPELGYLIEEYHFLRRRLIEFPPSKISLAIQWSVILFCCIVFFVRFDFETNVGKCKIYLHIYSYILYSYTACILYTVVTCGNVF